MAHRGYAGVYPENTIEAIKAAGEAGIRLIEFDIQLSSDRVPVVLHDADLQRTTGVARSIFATDMADLRSIEANYSELFGDIYSGIQLPTLEATLALLEVNPDWLFFIEVKRASIEHFGAAEVVEQLLPLIYQFLPQCVLISFDYDFLLEVTRRSDVHLGWVLDDYSESMHDKARALDPEYLIVNHKRLPPVDEPLWQGAWQWACYEVTDAAHARSLYARGVDIVSSMVAPDLQLALMRSDEAERGDTPIV